MEKLIPIKEAFFLRLVCTNGMITETRFSNSIINAYTSAANRPELLLEDVYRLQRIGGIILSMVK